ncbi:MAG: RHS repeat-associated core domain-containing protein [Bdellovibrionaceae bacterium]|nr:RHS repeat-associated core domain-containing protein [Pseudobdellovibrionaceae bacterium]
MFSYDVIGNLTQVTLPSGTVVDYNSDGLDRRAVKKVTGSVQWRYIYEDQYRVAAQLASGGSVQKEFVYATRVNVPDYMLNSSGTKFRIITDHLGSPRLVVKASDGTVSQRMDYTTLGEVVADTSAGFQPFGFAGGIYDGSTQLVRFGARDYDPRSGGRWTTKDPIRFEGQDTNLYGYVLNDPVNLIDPSGKLFEGWVGGFLSPCQQSALGAGMMAVSAAMLRAGVFSLNGGLVAGGALLGLEGGAQLKHAGKECMKQCTEGLGGF